jgi:phenylalanyl-tRNA synthetase beta chain
MKISHNWLKSLVPDLTATPAEVAEKLTLHSFETEVTKSVVIDPNVISAQIIKLEKHPQADRLQLATIDIGQSRVTVVCGAPNITEGDLVPYAPPGAVLTEKEGNTMTVKEATIRGQQSPGMLTSLRELGLGS